MSGQAPGEEFRDVGPLFRTECSFARAAAGRLGSLALTVLLAAVLGAVLVVLAPGSKMDERQLDARLTEESIRAIQTERAAAADLPRYVWTYLRGLVHGNLGVSLSLGRPVRELLSERGLLTLKSLALGLAIAWAIAAAASLAIGLSRTHAVAIAAGSVSGALLCLPSAVIGLFCFYAGAGPAFALAAVLLPRILPYLSNITRAVRKQPHVLAARARGSGGLGLLARHVWLPAGPEILGLCAVSVSMGLGASIPVEALCDVPGLGQLVWKAALSRDLPVLVNLTVLIAAVNAVSNLLADGGRAAMRRGA